MRLFMFAIALAGSFLWPPALAHVCVTHGFGHCKLIALAPAGMALAGT